MAEIASPAYVEANLPLLDRPYRTLLGGGDVLSPGLKPGAMMWTVPGTFRLASLELSALTMLCPHLSRVSNPWKGFSMINEQ